MNIMLMKSVAPVQLRPQIHDQFNQSNQHLIMILRKPVPLCDEGGALKAGAFQIKCLLIYHQINNKPFLLCQCVFKYD